MVLPYAAWELVSTLGGHPRGSHALGYLGMGRGHLLLAWDSLGYISDVPNVPEGLPARIMDAPGMSGYIWSAGPQQVPKQASNRAVLVPTWPRLWSLWGQLGK